MLLYWQRKIIHSTEHAAVHTKSFPFVLNVLLVYFPRWTFLVSFSPMFTKGVDDSQGDCNVEITKTGNPIAHHHVSKLIALKVITHDLSLGGHHVKMTMGHFPGHFASLWMEHDLSGGGSLSTVPYASLSEEHLAARTSSLDTRPTSISSHTRTHTHSLICWLKKHVFIFVLA